MNITWDRNKYILSSLDILSLDIYSIKKILRLSLKSGGVSKGYPAQPGSSWSYRPGTDPRSTQAGGMNMNAVNANSHLTGLALVEGHLGKLLSANLRI